MVPADCEIDFIGALGHRTYVSSEPPSTERVVALETQPLDNEYFEWIDLLESVEEAGDSYAMIEVGAGYGRWACRAALAAKQREIPRIRIGAVEGEPAHARWVADHFRLNGLAAEETLIYPCAAGAESGSAMFTISKSAEIDNEADARSWYGQRVAQGKLTALSRVEGREYFGHEVFERRNGSRLVEVPVRPLAEILEDFDHVDLIDFDIQGAELNVIEAAIESLTRQVSRIHIGTHSADVEKGLRDLLGARGWECRFDYSFGSECETPFGRIQFEDGVQSWRNPSHLEHAR